MAEHRGETHIHEAGDVLLAVLFCSDCAADVPHRVAYKRGLVVETVCAVCGRTLDVPERQWAELCRQLGDVAETSAAGTQTDATPDFAEEEAARAIDVRTVVSAGVAPSGASRAAAVGHGKSAEAGTGLPLLQLLTKLPASPRRLRALAAELPVRAVTKPGRLWREVRSHGAGVLLTMPQRAATKPVRLMAELAGLERRAR